MIVALLTVGLQLASADVAKPSPRSFPEAELRRVAADLAAILRTQPGGLQAPLVLGEFTTQGQLVSEQDLGRVVAGEISHLLATAHGAFVVERERLPEVLEELALQQQTGQLDNVELSTAAFQAGARHMIVGEVAQLGDLAVIRARILKVDEAKAVGRVEARVPLGALRTLAADSLLLRSRGGAAFRSVLIPGWGQYYNDQPTKAFVFGGSVALALGTALASHLVGQRYLTAYQENRPNTVADGDRAERAFLGRNIALFAALGLWALNLADAYLSGPEE